MSTSTISYFNLQKFKKSSIIEWLAPSSILYSSPIQFPNQAARCHWEKILQKFGWSSPDILKIGAWIWRTKNTLRCWGCIMEGNKSISRWPEAGQTSLTRRYNCAWTAKIDFKLRISFNPAIHKVESPFLLTKMANRFTSIWMRRNAGLVILAEMIFRHIAATLSISKKSLKRRTGPITMNWKTLFLSMGLKSAIKQKSIFQKRVPRWSSWWCKSRINWFRFWREIWRTFLQETCKKNKI